MTKLSYKKLYYQTHREDILRKTREYQRINRDKINERTRSRRAEHKYNNDASYQSERERARRRELKKYGMTVNEYNMLLQKQNGACAICRNPETAKNSNSAEIHKLTVDHNHQTGKIRGLLCKRCNSALGYFWDSKERLTAVLQYINSSTF